MARVIVNVLVDTAVASTISSRAVSGSMTRVKVVPLGIVAVPSRLLPLTTDIEVVPAVIAPVSVDCCERDVYWRVGIYVPSGYSERGLGIVFVVLESLRVSVVGREQKSVGM